MPQPSRRAFLALCLLPLAASAGLPEGEKTPSFAERDTGGTWIARRVAALGDPRDGRSGLHLVPSGPEALALRLVLIEKAERTIDAQYYILADDTSGDLILGHLMKAADRGVRVRLLVDDMYTKGRDPGALALAAHPKVEIRLFNPWSRDLGRALGGLLDFARVDRRMHNKAMTFDDAMTIVGGRNLADEYFAARESSDYDDLDVLAAGPAAREASAVFDQYWNSRFAVPIEALAKGGGMTPEEARARLAARYDAARASPYGAALGHEVRAKIGRATLALAWAPAHVLADPPEKAAGPGAGDLVTKLDPVIRGARRDLLVAAGYFVPGPRGTALLTGLAGEGTRVTVLTNSLQSNDVAPVYAHYAREREALLRGGVELWELRADHPRADRRGLALGQSRSGLHAKTFVVDEKRLFVGSFNWDPRSVAINSEMGILIDSPALAARVARGSRAALPEVAYRLRLGPTGAIEWLERGADGTWIAHPDEPGATGWPALRARLYEALPIEGEL